MLKKMQQKKKKPNPNVNLLFKASQKADKANLKVALNLFVPKPTPIIGSPKPNDFLKTYKLASGTPKHKPVKKSVKQNGYETCFVSTNNSYFSTPFDCETLEVKQKSRNDYRFLYQVGSGGFGRVWKVQQKKSNQILAMKQISKAKVILKKSVGSVLNQKVILDSLDNPFIINMKSAFQDREYLYMTMEYLRGGDLRYHICFYQFFNEEQTKFVAACIILALQYIHSNGIIHRDLKPENLVFEENGYLRVTDFGVARRKKDNNSDETSGTPGYMAPEVICRMNHSFEADFFALGVILYEMMMGSRPYMGDTRKQIRDKILAHQARITEKEVPMGWSMQSMNFVNKLLKRNKETRLGYNGIEELKKHQWFAGVSWRKLGRKEIMPPFIPGIVTQSIEYQKEMENTQEIAPNQDSQMLLRTVEIQNLFKDYSEYRSVKKQLKF